MARKGPRNPGLFVVGQQQGERLPNVSTGKFITEESIPESGIYRVIHSKSHRLPHEVTLIGGERFPRCGGCDDAVEFELMQAAPYIGHLRGIRVYELPVLNRDAEAEEDSVTS